MLASYQGNALCTLPLLCHIIELFLANVRSHILVRCVYFICIDVGARTPACPPAYPPARLPAHPPAPPACPPTCKTCMRMHTHTQSHSHTCTQARKHTHANIHKHNTFAQHYTHIHTHTHTPTMFGTHSFFYNLLVNFYICFIYSFSYSM